jgi:hypothetical protein
VRGLLRALRAAIVLGTGRDYRLQQIEALVGARGVDDALDLAIEAAKLNLHIDDLLPMVSAWHDLRMLGLERGSGQGFVSWARKHGFVSQAQFEAAQALDLLAMRDTDEHDEHEIGRDE